MRKALYSAIVMLTLSMLITGCFSRKSPAAASHGDAPPAPSLEKAPSRDVTLPPKIAAPAKDQKEERKEATVAPAAPPAPVEEVSAEAEKKREQQPLLDEALELVEASQEDWKSGDADGALEALDQAYGLIMNVDHDGEPKLMQQKEDLRFTISKRILEIYASRKRTVKGSHNAIPLTMNKYVEREIRSFQTKERGFFIEAYKRSGRYRGDIVRALKDAGLPEELSWLPFIESGFKVKALSPARALGLWQFIPSTGYKFGLRRNEWIDERMDPEKSTRAAIAYLKELHQMFGDWATVLAAYNCGEGTVLRAIRRQNINYLDNFWDLYERLPHETARYYPRFLATLAILKDPARYDFRLDEPEAPRRCEVVTVEKQLHLGTVAKNLSMAKEELCDLNPELRRQITPGAPYPLLVPEGKGGHLQASLAALPKWSPPKKSYVVHRVKKGETLSRIAVRYRTSIRAIADTNNLRRGHVIRIGQRLMIPFQGTS